MLYATIFPILPILAFAEDRRKLERMRIHDKPMVLVCPLLCVTDVEIVLGVGSSCIHYVLTSNDFLSFPFLFYLDVGVTQSIR